MTGPVPTPADVVGARVVVLCARARVWPSPHLSPADAEALHETMSKTVADIGDASGLVGFECGDGRHVWIRARQLESIELRNATLAPLEVASGPDQRYRPVVPEPPALTAEEIAETVVRP